MFTQIKQFCPCIVTRLQLLQTLLGQVNQTFVEMKKAEMWTYDFREENITALGITNVYWMDTVRDNSTYGRLICPLSV